VADLRRGAREAELRRAERLLKKRPEAALSAVIFMVGAMVGTTYYSRFVAKGGRPFFYQTYFEPAVMLACGKGFLIAPQQPPALRAFLFQETDRFSCDQLPRDLKVGTEGLYQRPWRYLMTAVAITWRIVGISWSRLAPLFGVLYGTTTVLVYALARLIVARIAAIACAAAMCASTMQLANLVNLRDYAKAPFTMALVLILVVLVMRPWRARGVLVLSLCYGLVMGIGYGFRGDLLVDIPPFLIAVFLFLPDGVFRHLALKSAAAAAFVAGFVIAAWPILWTVVSRGGCQWHVFLLGLADQFNEPLGVSGGAYSWGRLYKDEYVWATVSSYAQRVRPDLGYIEYCSHEYDVASWDYLRHILTTFPADIVTRAYASTLRVLDLPLQRFVPLQHAGPLAAAAFVSIVSTKSLRLAFFASFVILYFGGHPAIQFLPRHYFVFEFITFLIVVFLIERGVRLGIAVAARNRVDRWWSGAQVRSIAICAATLVAALGLPLVLLRSYQHGRVSRLLHAYVDSPTSPMGMHSIAPGQFRLPDARDAGHKSEVDAVTALGRARVRFLEADVDLGMCRPGTTVTFHYDRTFPATDLSYAVPLRTSTGPARPTRLFEPVYDGFRGVDVSDASPACALRFWVLNDVDRFALLLPAQLSPGWESQPQYQRITNSR
jgi:hypothetical protein